MRNYNGFLMVASLVVGLVIQDAAFAAKRVNLAPEQSVSSKSMKPKGGRAPAQASAKPTKAQSSAINPLLLDTSVGTNRAGGAGRSMTCDSEVAGRFFTGRRCASTLLNF